MYGEDDLLPLSALQHLLFCERQCALIHVEREWADNALTVEGSHLHEKVDSGAGETRTTVKTVRSLRLRSSALGLVGKADVVQFRLLDEAFEGVGVRLPRTQGLWAPAPVEYKRGRPKPDLSDKVQLCAQAICLEEMLGVRVASGALFYWRTRRRLTVEFDDELRAAVSAAAHRLHEIVSAGITPKAQRLPKCDRCSLLSICMPEAMDPERSVARYMAGAGTLGR